LKFALFLAIFLLSSINAYADWLCTEEASQLRGDSVIACGVGLGPTEAMARQDALEKAKQEFEGICEQSYHCRGHETKVEPLRNSCSPNPKGYECVRGFRYEILEEMKEVVREPASSEPTNDTPKLNWRLQLGVGYSGDSNSNIATAPGYFCCGTFEANLQRNLYGRLNLGLRLSYRAGATPTQQLGSPTTSSSGVEFGVSLPFETFENWFLVPEAGYLSGNVTTTQGLQTYTTSFQDRFVGGQLKYQSGLAEVNKVNVGWYWYAGYRKYLNASGAPNAGIGVQFGF